MGDGRAARGAAGGGAQHFLWRVPISGPEFQIVSQDVQPAAMQQLCSYVI